LIPKRPLIYNKKINYQKPLCTAHTTPMKPRENSNMNVLGNVIFFLNELPYFNITLYFQFLSYSLDTSAEVKSGLAAGSYIRGKFSASSSVDQK
jgi:hypothetical protein